VRLGRLVAASLVALAVLAGAAHASGRVTVTLRAAAPTAEIGTGVTLKAVVHGFRRGDRVQVVARRGGAGVLIKLATCARASCTARYGDRVAENVSFRALVIRHGSAVARSRLAVVAWQKPPTPPAPGHYCGLTEEGKSICFDVTAPRVSIANLVTESISRCGDGTSWVWRLAFTAPVPIALPALTASHHYAGPLPDVEGTKNIQIDYDIQATFDTAGNATGTLSLNHVAWDSGDKHYDCRGTPLPWRARLGA
jgi:hypothetical protein